MTTATKPHSSIRRAVQAAAVAAGFVIASPAWSPAHAQQAQQTRTTLQSRISVKQAYQLSLGKQIHLIDIRTPKEWQGTGIPRTATPITMHQNFTNFLSQLRRTAATGPGLPIALICAHGNRSRYIQRLLTKNGYTNIIDVNEGMLGSSQGPGWLKTGLPTRAWSPGNTQ